MPQEMPSQQNLKPDESSHLGVRKKVPQSLAQWRLPPVAESEDLDDVYEAVWKPLYPFFQDKGYTFWRQERGTLLCPDVDLETDEVARYSHNYAYATQHRGIALGPGSINDLFGFEYLNPLCRAARTVDGRDVVVRILSMGERDREHVEILKVISMGTYAFYNDNHTIPLVEFVHYDDLTFGVFPKIGFRVEEAYGYWAKNSVGDILDMILQCLEALTFIHALAIAHRDAFKDNFLVQWHPESLVAGHIPRSRPRVFLTDFEVAVIFPDETPLEECLVSGYPTGGSYPSEVSRYARRVPPEVTSGERYNAFKLDVWQFGASLANFKSTFPRIDRILDGLRTPDAASRLTSFDALEYLSRAVAELTPKALMIPPVVDKVL